jgi:hypothetical protein
MTSHAGGWHQTTAAALLAVACLDVGTAFAQVAIPGYPNRAEDFDPREVAMLPRYCIYTQLFRQAVPGGDDPTVIAQWYEYMGPTFHHVHHYCFGLMKMNRAMYLARGDQNARRFYLSDAVIEMEYVISKADDKFVLMPEMLTKKGETLALLGKGASAVLHFERAIQVKSDYWPAYAQLSDYYKESGDNKRAREVLESGLSRVPDAKALQRRLGELDSVSPRGGAKR